MSGKFKFALVVIAFGFAIYLDHKYFHVLNHIGLLHGCSTPDGHCK